MRTFYRKQWASDDHGPQSGYQPTSSFGLQRELPTYILFSFSFPPRGNYSLSPKKVLLRAFSRVSYFFLQKICSFVTSKKILGEKKEGNIQEFLIIHS